MVQSCSQTRRSRKADAETRFYSRYSISEVGVQLSEWRVTLHLYVLVWETVAYVTFSPKMG